MPVAATDATIAALAPGAGGVWWFRRWAAASSLAGVTSRQTDPATLRGLLPPGVRLVDAEQVHGGSVAMLGRAEADVPSVPGCDGLVTGAAGLALLIRTADCLPVLVTDPVRQVVGIAHVGWRGLAAALPARLMAAMRHTHHSCVRDLQVAIGPAIRACCYEVGPEFAARFGPFVRERRGRRTCDLVGVAIAQLRRCGMAAAQVADCGQCTACEPDRWFSLRREGPAAGRMVSFIVVKP